MDDLEPLLAGIAVGVVFLATGMAVAVRRVLRSLSFEEESVN